MALDRETVVRTALRLLDADGLERLTLRRIAGELDVQAPALYWHFKNKQELLDAMATTVLTDATRETADWTGLPWREFLPAYAHGLRGALLRYRDGAKMVPGTYLTDPAMFAVMERALGVLTGAGFSARTASTALSTIYCYTVGFAIEEQAVHPRPGESDPRYTPEARRRRISADTEPTVDALNRSTPLDGDRDADFDHGLRLIIAGLAAESPSP
ncbi:TetR/AcrR family transcriptional regulator C-terminal domain-containing protein [Microlunatus speluncae]|uniref:TetR/AcrR family transcriptional regulator C-terminal domain-containing protein n=1 Tax=Microlunatus speluncae TaxID=2594267 RepID=UPI00126617E1|nr:TetR/AcrR family transcriptional regulator C-terminal domain-containing protein [Microlunatus speluncae]